MGQLIRPEALFLTAILAGDRELALEEATLHFEREGVASLYERLVRPALVQVGARWALNQISVADEHLATATAQSAVAALYPRFLWPERGQRVLIACVEGERHDFGARMVADLLGLDGWKDLFLGADVPSGALVEQAAQLSPTFIALSVTLPQHLPSLERLIRQLREAVPRAKLLIGGSALAHHPDAAKQLGGDAGGQSAAQAVELARPWRSIR